MNGKRLVVGTLVGGVILYILGYLIFNVAFAEFYAANAGPATGVPREPQLLWAVAVGGLAYAALITLAVCTRPGEVSVGTGIQAGAIVGFLLWLTADFIIYGITNISTLTTAVVDPLLELVRGGVSGAVIAAVIGRIPPR